MHDNANVDNLLTGLVARDWDPNADDLDILVGLLTSGIVPVMRHCIQTLMADDMVVIPMSATVYVQAAEVRTRDARGVDVSAVNRHRWHPAYTAGEQPPFASLKPI